LIKTPSQITRRNPSDVLAGVIEGFYGQPWSPQERFQLFEWMEAWGLNTYLYAPKDDLKHRAIWRESYTLDEEANLRQLIAKCKQRNLQFIYAISPGLDIRYSSGAEHDILKKRLEQMLQIGCEHFALLFDDIPDRMDHADAERFGSFASAQSHTANGLFTWCRTHVPEGLFLFCPTAYCGRMNQQQLGGKDYLTIIGRELLSEIDIFWTGPEIVSCEITESHITELATVLRRKPLIWDNLHANDYDGRRFYCGPYSGRPLELRNQVRGFLSNPNNEFPLNFIPLRTLGEFIQCEGTWDARNTYLKAMREWAPSFATIGMPITEDDLILFGDCYYLPHEEGTEAQSLHASAAAALKNPSDTSPVREFQEKAARLRAFCARLTELRDRPLFYALSRRAWELREELDLLLQYVASASRAKDAPVARSIETHLPETYRGGLVSRLQRLLLQRSDGSFIPAAAT
jgi:protein O-GlcNAcase/histone acetyltransferase